MKNFSLLLLFSGLVFYAEAQEYLGIANSNYAGILGTGLNPSSFVDSKLKFDINILSGGVTLDNTFLYIPKEDLTFFGIGNIVEIIKDKEYLDRFDPDDPNAPHNFTYSADAIGPSFMINFAERYSLGFTTGAHFFLNANNVPAHLAKNAYEELNDQELWGTNWAVNNMDHNMIGWFEYALSYGMILYQNEEHQFNGGLNVKLLNGVGAEYMGNADITYNIINDNDIYFGPTAVEYGRTDFNSYDPTENYKDLIHGGGFGWDIGFTYEWLRDSSEWTYEMDQKKWADPDKNKYKLRIGASLIDLGSY
jgi:hypothetical protein